MGIPLFEETSIYKDYMKCIGQSLLVKRLSQSLAGLLVAIQFPFIATKIKDKTTHPRSTVGNKKWFESSESSTMAIGPMKAKKVK